MLQSSWTDPVLGVDIHILLVPTPAGPVPTPLPLPFTGIVLDPAGAAINAALGGSTVLAGGMPATHCGTAVVNLPPHIPAPGPPQTGKFDNDAKLLFGALNVSICGNLAVRLGDIALSCGDPTRMPTSVVLAIPKGSLILTMPAMVPDIGLIVQELAFAAFRWWQKSSKLWAAISEKLRFAEENPSRLQQLWNDTVCFLTGHPVDVATGRVITRQTDLELRGPLPLRFERRYDTAAASRSGTLAPGWSHNYQEALWPERGRFVYRASDGREIEFSTLHLPDHVLNAGDSVYLARERLTLRCVRQYQYAVEDANGTVREFFAVPKDPSGRARLVRLRSRLGDEQRFAYDANGRLERVTDPSGRALTFEYDAANHLARVDVVGTDGKAERVGLYTYDRDGDLVEARDALGNSYRYEYVEHLLVKETNKNGLSFYFQYDGVDSTSKCIRTWGDGGIYDHVITYAPDGSKTLVENSLGHITLYELDPRGQVVAVTDALGRKTAYEYDDKTGQKLLEIAPGGAETKREYDARGNLVRVIDPDGATHSVEYGPGDQPARALDPIDGEWVWRYDDAGRIRSRTNSLGATTEFTWNGTRLMKVVDAAGRRTVLDYDAVGDLASVTHPDGATVRWSHDGLGRIRSYTDANGNSIRRHRDPLGRLERLEEPDGNRRRFEYDAEGNLTRAVDKYRDTRFEYAGLNRMRSRTESGTRVEFEYDTEDRLVAVKNAEGSVYRFVLDGVGDTSEEYGFDGLRRRYVRDDAGRVKLVVRPAGKTTEYAYDENGRVVGVSYSDGCAETFSYRRDGELLSAKNDQREVVFERDALGRLLKELQGDDWVASEFGPLGVRERVSSSRGALVRIRRNVSGHAMGVDAFVDERATDVSARGATPAAQNVSSFNATFERDRFGLELERALPGGIRSRWKRDALGRPIQQEIARREHSEVAKQYSWDAEYRLLRIVDTETGPIDYEHDPLGRLVATSYADGSVELRLPDAVGNLFRSGTRGDRTYGRAGELVEMRTARGTTRFEYDDEGNLSKKVEADGSTFTYEWNGAGMLVRVVRPDGKPVTFEYDAVGRRTAKSFLGKTTRWIWDGNVPLHEWIETTETANEPPRTPEGASRDVREKTLRDLLVGRPAQGPPTEFGGTSDAPITWLFTPESHAPLGKLVNGEHYGIVTDHLGAPTRMYDGEGNEVWAATIDAYGDLREPRGARGDCPFRWPGQYEDSETGLYYNRFRYYDPTTGEYASRDPLGLIASLNLYAYPSAPNTSIDPLGLYDEWDVAPYGSSGHSGDGLDAHELLQSKWLRDHGYGDRGSAIGRQNPAMAVDPELHKGITADQREAGLFDDEVIANQTARQNINANAKILEARMEAKLVAEGMEKEEAKDLARARVKEMKQDANEFAKLHCG